MIAFTTTISEGASPTYCTDLLTDNLEGSEVFSRHCCCCYRSFTDNGSLEKKPCHQCFVCSDESKVFYKHFSSIQIYQSEPCSQLYQLHTVACILLRPIYLYAFPLFLRDLSLSYKPTLLQWIWGLQVEL